MAKRPTFLGKTLRKIPLYKKDLERKLAETQKLLEDAQEDLYQRRRQGQLDRKKIDESQRERDALQTKCEHLKVVLRRYASDADQVQRLREQLEFKTRENTALLKKRSELAEGPVEENATKPEDQVTRTSLEGKAMDPALQTHEEQLAVVPHSPTNVVRSQGSPLSARVAVLPLTILLSSVTRFLQRGPVYPDILDSFRRPIFSSGSIIQMMLFNIIIVTLLGEYARYKIRRRMHEQSGQLGNAELGAAFAHWDFVRAVSEEAWNILLIATMAFALLLFELDHLFRA